MLQTILHNGFQMSIFPNRSKSWRFGWQVMAGVMSISFFLGVLYRPASLYHPQRRAILHLKSLQKRSRLKDQHLKQQQQTGHLHHHATLQSTGTVQSGPGVMTTTTIDQENIVSPADANKEKKVQSSMKSMISSSSKAEKSSSEKPPYFDLSILKSRTVQIILSGTCISHFGMTAPILLLVS